MIGSLCRWRSDGPSLSAAEGLGSSRSCARHREVAERGRGQTRNGSDGSIPRYRLGVFRNHSPVSPTGGRRAFSCRANRTVRRRRPLRGPFALQEAGGGMWRNQPREWPVIPWFHAIGRPLGASSRGRTPMAWMRGPHGHSLWTGALGRTVCDQPPDVPGTMPARASSKDAGPGKPGAGDDAMAWCASRSSRVSSRGPIGRILLPTVLSVTALLLLATTA